METTTAEPGSIGKIEGHDLGRLRAAAVHATTIYPGAIGELLARELRAYADFGYRFAGDDGLIGRLAAEILRPPVPAR